MEVTSRLAWLVLVAACRTGPTDPCSKARPEGPLAWLQDDYASAMTCARTKHVPVVVDLWAPWCHTCLSMQTTVFQDSSFAADHDRFVFVALDTDREVNAPALTKMSISAWPTFYVLDPDNEQVLARFVGAASVQQFHTFLEAGAKARQGGTAAVDARMLGAERALAAKDYATADEELAAVLSTATPDWPRLHEATYYRLLAISRGGDPKRCLEFGESALDGIGTDALATNFLELMWDCAEKLEMTEPARAVKLHEEVIARWRQILADVHAQLSIDDRAEALGYLRDALDQTGKHDDAHQVAEQSRVLLDDAAAKAPDAMAAMTYNWPRADVYAYLGRPLDLVPALEKSARDLPDEYDPRARLGWIYWKAGKLADAAKWTDEALPMVYGPRKGRLLEQRAEIAGAAGDHDAERRYREQEVKLYESLPPGQESADALAKAREALGLRRIR
jgi:thiol-disulfide isomerase/thioredoxin